MRGRWTAILVIILLFLGGIIGLFLFLMEPRGTQTQSPVINSSDKEIFGLTGWILDIDRENNLLTIKSERYGSTPKVFVNNTSLLKIALPEELPEGKQVLSTTKTKISLAELQIGDYISLTSSENIAGKNQFSANRIIFYPFAVPLGAIIDVEKPKKECNEFPDWNSPGLCYLRTSYRANLEGVEIGASLDACFYQIRNKIDGEYRGSTFWQTYDCHGYFLIKVKLPMEIGQGGDCYARGQEACQGMVILNKQNNITSIGSRIYNIY